MILEKHDTVFHGKIKQDISLKNIIQNKSRVTTDALRPSMFNSSDTKFSSHIFNPLN